MTEETSQIQEVKSNSDQFLTFTVGSELYGVKLLNVQEIRGWGDVARVPNVPEYIKGVMNLRGTAVPVVDLRLRGGNCDARYLPSTVMIILRALINGQERVAGIVVDAVSDVLNIVAADIRKTPEFGDRIDTDFINGLVDSDGHMVMLFDAQDFLMSPDLRDEDPETDSEE